MVKFFQLVEKSIGKNSVDFEDLENDQKLNVLSFFYLQL